MFFPGDIETALTCSDFRRHLAQERSDVLYRAYHEANSFRLVPLDALLHWLRHHFYRLPEPPAPTEFKRRHGW